MPILPPEDSLESEEQKVIGGDMGPLEPETQSSSKSEDRDGDESTVLLQQLEEENQRLSRRNTELQNQAAYHLRGTAPHGQDPEPDIKEYQECLEHLAGLRKQRASHVESAQEQEEELRRNNHDQLKQVEDEWRSLWTLKRKLALSLLRGHLSPEAARSKVDAALVSEQLWRQDLRKLRLTHVEMESRVLRLEAELRQEEQEEAQDLLLRQFKQLLAQKILQQKVDGRRSQEASKLRKNIKRTLELLSNMKEKLHWSQTEMQAKREQLAQLEATLSSRRDLLARTKRAAARLQRGNVELKQKRGLLGNIRLVWDFAVTADAAQQLQEKLDKLKRRQEQFASL